VYEALEWTAGCHEKFYFFYYLNPQNNIGQGWDIGEQRPIKDFAFWFRKCFKNGNFFFVNQEGMDI
jgi:hypothetical protein